MKSARPAHRCTECGYASAKWVGRCPECQAWGTIAEVGSTGPGLRAVSAGPVTAPARPIAEVEVVATVSTPSRALEREEGFDFHEEEGAEEGDEQDTEAE